MGGTLRAWAELARPLNAALAVLGVTLGGYLAAGAHALRGEGGRAVALAALAATLVGAGANALNDRLDLATDRINRPDRPLPSGRAAPAHAVALWAGLSALAVALASAVSAWHAAVAAASVAVLVVYSRWLKGTPLAGNAVVSAVTAFALVFGSRAAAAHVDAHGARAALLAAAFAAAVTFARELVKDIEDVAGDRAAGLDTAPVRWGVRPAAAGALAVIAAVVAVLPLPVWAEWAQPPFLLGAVGAAAALVLAAQHLWPPAAPASPARASAWLKAAMLFGMVALALGR